jgi:DNA-directed RNA polymerase subunit RPC12/RpoP
MDVLKLQYVHDEQSRFVHIDHAVKGQNYFCPACKSQLFLKAGRVKAKHFSHSKGAACSIEDLKRVISTHLITQVIQSNINSVSTISLNRLCVRCDQQLTQRIQPGYISGYESNYSSEGESCD